MAQIKKVHIFCDEESGKEALDLASSLISRGRAKKVRVNMPGQDLIFGGG